MGILSVGTQALLANQLALQTAGNNIANVNTPGYSRQNVVLETVPSQYSGSGYIGKGVNAKTIQRNFSEFLTRQSTLAGSIQAADTTRADKLKQLETLFQGGSSGLGASINDMLNAFSDVASAPTDLTARTVALTRVDEAAARMRSAALQITDLQKGVSEELTQKVNNINSLAKDVASVNKEVARAIGSGQSPNDLLDRRDQLVKELNQYIQTTSVAADDGTVSLFIGGSQSLVLGDEATPVLVMSDDFNDPLKKKLAINRSGVFVAMDENTLGGGEVSGLLRFQNTDLIEGSNLLGRLTMAVTESMNAQHRLGLDLDGNIGGDLFTPVTFSGLNVLQPVAPAVLNSGNASLSLAISDPTKFAASDYEVTFTGATDGSITRRSDGQVTLFDFAVTTPVTIDGIAITQAGGAGAGDRFLLKPFSTQASNVTRQFSTPRALAVASPVAGNMGAANIGSLQQTALIARSNPPATVPVTLTFTGANTYTRSDDPSGTVFNYLSGQAIEATLPDVPLTAPPTYSNPLVDWSIVLKGTPQPGDTYSVHYVLDTPANDPFIQGKADYKLNSGNATAMMNLRDVAMFDGAAMTDGYAGMISQIGIRTQSANYSTTVSTSIAINLEKDRNGVAGVNLDEEAAKLLQFQQAYQASAKMIQIAQGIFDTLMQSVSR